MNHFEGVNNQERYNNEVLQELRKIRELLERNAQAVEQTEVKKVVEKPAKVEQIKRRGRREGAVNQ